MNTHDTLAEKYGQRPLKPAPLAAVRAQSEAAQRVARYENAHPELAPWWKDAKPGTFQHSLRSGVAQYGHLTEKQLAAALASITRDKVAPSMDVSKIEHVFAVALKNGIKRPKLRLGGVVFSLGRAGSQYDSTIFVNDKDRNYLGRVTAGKFNRGNLCPPAKAEEIAKLGEDPMAAAVAYGRVTGQCAICGRQLDNADSIARGIGPICYDKVFG